MGRGALRRDNQQSTFAHIHTSLSHSTTSLWSPIPYLHCVSTEGGLAVPVRPYIVCSHRRMPTHRVPTRRPTPQLFPRPPVPA